LHYADLCAICSYRVSAEGKAAKELGLQIPLGLIARADKVAEMILLQL